MSLSSNVDQFLINASIILGVVFNCVIMFCICKSVADIKFSNKEKLNTVLSVVAVCTIFLLFVCLYKFLTSFNGIAALVIGITNILLSLLSVFIMSKE